MGKTPGKMKTRLSTLTFVVFAGMAIVAINALPERAEAEYGDVVINEFSDDAGMRPVVFPHWFHRIRFRCKVCHGDLGFAFKAGGNQIDMVKIIDGQYCGACHDGDVAWSIENCELCHSGQPNTPTQVHHSTVQQLINSGQSSANDDEGAEE
jgi:c(7)-type cytochrome triheme protein